MGPRFDPDLPLKNGGQKVMACGPIGWHRDDVSMELDIVIQQDGHGTARASSPPVFLPPDDEWMLTAKTQAPRGGVDAATLVTGQATGRGLARFRKTDGRTVPVPWTQTVNLV